MRVSFYFIKRLLFCQFVTPMLHPIENKIAPLQRKETKRNR